MMTIKELQERAHKTAVEKGWWGKGRGMGEILANIHAEVSEAWEEWRDPSHSPKEVYYDCSRGPHPKPCGFGIELADILIRVADLAEVEGIDLEGALRIKMDYNETRPYRHGGKRA